MEKMGLAVADVLLRGRRPGDREFLANWIQLSLGMHMPRVGVCPGHATPLDYLAHSFFEEGGDAVVWACRGGGKTMVGAVATLLDMLFKPGVQVRILGGSFEQSERMYAYLRQLVRRNFEKQLLRRPTERRLEFKNGSKVEVLAQSDQSVRGQRVQKLRCDEVELFDSAVWQAAQLTTRSDKGVIGTVEAFSTMHKPGGLMQQILHGGGMNAGATRKVFAWCVWDVIEKCPPGRSCASCPLWDACQGRAKKADGFVSIDDVIQMRGRVSQATWEHEMLCKPPRFEDAVFAAYRPEASERSVGWGGASMEPGAEVFVDGRRMRVENVVCGVDFGFQHPFVCLWVAMLREEGKRVAWVIDEMVEREKTLAWNAQKMRGRAWNPAVVYCDVAGRRASSHTGQTDERVLRDAGFNVRSSGMQIVPGVAAIGELLSPAIGATRLLIDPRCVQLIAAMKGYRWGKGHEPLKDGVHDHLIDALRYAVVNHEGKIGRVEVRTY